MVYGRWIRYDIYGLMLADNSNGDSHDALLWVLYDMLV